jgi:hypothetical protein
MRRWSVLIAVVVAVVLAGGGLSTANANPVRSESGSSIPRADCGPGSHPETGMQGQVSLADRKSGRNKQGYSCNLRVLGQYQGEGTSVVSPSYARCAYLSTAFGGLDLATKKSAGVQVLDVSDPREPRRSTTLTSPAMATNTWESLKVNERRGLLAGVSVGSGWAACSSMSTTSRTIAPGRSYLTGSTCQAGTNSRRRPT